MSDPITSGNRPSTVVPPPRKQSAGRETPEELQSRKKGGGIAPHSRIATRSRTHDGRTLQQPIVRNEELLNLANRNVRVGKKKNNLNTKWERFTKAVVDFFNLIFRGCIGIRERTVVIPTPEIYNPVTQNLNRMITRRVEFDSDRVRTLSREKQKEYSHHIECLQQELAVHANGLGWNRKQMEQTSFRLSSIDDILGIPDAEDIDKFDRGEFESIESSRTLKKLENPTTPQLEKLDDKVQMLQKMAAQRKTKYNPQVLNLTPYLQNIYTLDILALHKIINSHLDQTELTQMDIVVAEKVLQDMDTMFAAQMSDIAAFKK